MQSTTDNSVVLAMPGGVTPTLTFLVCPDGRIALPQDPRWDMLVLKETDMLCEDYGIKATCPYPPRPRV